MEDEWERELESEDDLDLLFVTYNTKQITIEQLIATIAEHGFAAEVKTASDENK